jgi:hypothetical protein
MTEEARYDDPVSHVRDVCALGYGPDVQGCVALDTEQGLILPEAPGERPLLLRLEARWGVA